MLKHISTPSFRNPYFSGHNESRSIWSFTGLSMAAIIDLQINSPHYFAFRMSKYHFIRAWCNPAVNNGLWKQSPSVVTLSDFPLLGSIGNVELWDFLNGHISQQSICMSLDPFPPYKATRFIRRYDFCLHTILRTTYRLNPDMFIDICKVHNLYTSFKFLFNSCYQRRKSPLANKNYFLFYEDSMCILFEFNRNPIEMTPVP